MTTKTRYFVIASLLVLSVGLGVGLIAYYGGLPTSAFSRQGGPEELQFLPPDASLVAYVDVRDIMTSPLRERLRALFPLKTDGQHEFAAQTGINIETDIDSIVAALAPSRDAGSAGRGAGLVVARGRFDVVKIEALMREHGGQVEEYKNKRLVVGQPGPKGPSLSLAFLESGLVAVGSSSLVRSAVDLSVGGASVTSNESVMNLVRDLDSGDAWAVGRFDALTSQAQLPPGVGERLPSIQWFSATAQVDTGVRGVLKVEAKDDEAAAGMRDVVRGFMALARLQTSSRPEFETLLRSLELGGTGKTVALSFDIPSELIDALGSLSQSRPNVQRQTP